MIDVSQWRASIGLWNCCQTASSRQANGHHSHSFKDEAINRKSENTTKTLKMPAALLVIAFLLLLFYFLSLSRHILIIPPTGNCYQAQCITGATVTNKNYLQSEVLPGSSSSNLIYDDLYLIVCLRMLLLLSGDVELNPGPMIDDRPDILLLIEWLEPLVDWKPFGLHLVGISRHDVLKIEQEHVQIEDRKLSLYSKWLSVNPKATWRNVIDALTSTKENKLKQDIKVAIERVSKESPLSPISDGDVEVILFPKEDQKAQDSLNKLQIKFSHIMTKVIAAFYKRAVKNSRLHFNISNWVESYLHWEHGTVDNDLDDVFKKIYHNYDFIDCSLIVAMSDEFIGDEKDLLDELKAYSSNAKAFHSSEPITELKQKLRKVYGPYRRRLENMPLICIELQNPWNDVTISGLYILIGRLIPKELRQSLMKCITIEEGSVVIKLHILDITAESLVKYTGGKLQFMRLIGIFSLYINDHPVLQEDENMNFTFELALLKAVRACNNEAVEFLLQLETVNINHINNEGKTALMLACERGHEEIVHNLLSAGADCSVQNNSGWTALMMASEHNYISIILMLLQATDLKKSNGSNALMIASYHGNYEVVELLISRGVDYGVNAFMLACQNGHTKIVELFLKKQVDPIVQKKDGWNAFMLACQNGHTQIVKLLLEKQVDPNFQKNNGWNAFMSACKNGHAEIVKLLLKEKVNPNVQMNDGWNAFMSACKNGHTQIVELLLKEQVDPNVQKEDGWNAFMLACQNGHTQTVELLLKEKIDPNAQEKDGWNAFMLASENGHIQTVELLLKEQAIPNVQDKYGWNAFMLACQNGHIEIVQLLLKEQVDPNVQEKDGWNALMIACQNGHTQIIELLMEKEVDPNVQNNNGWNALMLACQYGHTQIVKLLVEQVDPNVQRNTGWNAFMLACQNGHNQIVKLLLKKQVAINVQNNNDITALMFPSAEGEGQYENIEWEANTTIHFSDSYSVISV
ncbi:PREDICTED: uncharacterized protein LOC109583413 [Amphimedon queenslandica]|uniref:Uncharacterized protein n=1 Tax=Amphimedon queenslandica TaxID=400682 RepID=A0A1X7VT66_AMPQE|nr:PREDICTED: uncharacterized protein LOC109583413 [Amphimedon queenslandica]|eukprot:XP_019854303.1 PREDICTED: uncharacterized protein LOC109583413 [Amphimedon queenslandica]